MTVSQLYKSVAQLGFEDSLEGDERFIFAANRALLQVNAIRPATSSYIINHKPMDNMLADATFTPVEKKATLSTTQKMLSHIILRQKETERYT